MGKRIGIFVNSLAQGGAERVAAILHRNLSTDNTIYLILLEDVNDQNIAADDYIVLGGLFKNKKFRFLNLPFWLPKRLQ